METLHELVIEGDLDVVRIRQTVRRLMRLLEFEHRDEIRLAAATSELARAAASAGHGVAVRFLIDGDTSTPPQLVVAVEGAGLAPERRERGGRAMEGLIAAERLVPRCTSREPANAQTVLLGLPLSRRAADVAARTSALRAALATRDALAASAAEEIRQQDTDLAVTLLELEQRQQDLVRLNAELSDTNRGVMALYAELDERANSLRRADELKTRFFSNMSHEFRTPLNSVLALTQMLLDGADGPLTAEQRKQIGLIKSSVSELLDLVGDLLDLAKVEAGKTRVSAGEFSVVTLFGALRGMIRPLLGGHSVALELGGAEELPPLVSDEGKIAQILRNFLSNAVKFTEQGTITVTARLLPPGGLPPDGGPALEEEAVLFAVADTGIGIAARHQRAIFEEFGQVEHRLQRRVRGTGLGLPLCRQLAGLLRGHVWVASEVGRGSTFYLLVPRAYAPAAAQAERPPGAMEDKATPIEALGHVLVLDDDATFRELLTRQLQQLSIGVVATDDWRAALAAAERGEIDCAVLDLLMPEVDGLSVLERLRATGSTRDLPVLVCSSKVLSSDEQDAMRRLRAAFLAKDRLDVERLAQGLLEARQTVPRVGVVSSVSGSLNSCRLASRL